MNIVKLLFLFIVLSLITETNAQIKVNNNGYVEVFNKLFISKNGNTLRLYPDNPGVEIGSSIGTINFWYTNVGYNILYAKRFDKISDSTLKCNIQPFEKGMELLSKLKVYSYNMNDGEKPDEQIDYGFLAHELEEILPDLVSETNGYKAIDYMSLIPLLVNAMKEMHVEMQTLREQLIECCGIPKSLTEAIGDNAAKESEYTEAGMKLYQNAPNPFNIDTRIKCYIPDNVRNARLCIYNMQGVQIRCITVMERENTEVILQAGELGPGIYVYLLLGDDQASEAKQMIVTH